jgi:hypothetical protein
LPACGALRVIFNSLKVPLSTSVLSHDGALLDGVVSDWEADIASKGHQTSITYLLIQRNAVENLSKLRTLTLPHLGAKRTVVFANVVVHLTLQDVLDHGRHRCHFYFLRIAFCFELCAVL